MTKQTQNNSKAITRHTHAHTQKQTQTAVVVFHQFKCVGERRHLPKESAEHERAS